MMLRAAVLSAALLTLFVLEAVVAPAVAVLGVPPDLTVLAVVCLGLADGPDTGARFGFVAGFARDLLVPVTGLMGPWTLALMLVGFGSGALRPLVIGSALPGKVVAGVCGAVAASLVSGMLSLILGAGPAFVSDVLLRALVVGLWAVVLTPLLCPLMHVVSARSTPSGVSGS